MSPISQQQQIMARRLLTICILVGLSLGVAILLFLLFGELNSAVFQQPGLKLGGPVAAFFATLYLLWRIYKEMRFVDNPLESRLQPLVGRWQIESRSSESGRKAISRTTIELRDGELYIDGGTFFAVAADGSKGDPIGTWNVEMAVSDGRRLKYFYTLADGLASPSTWRGLVEAALQDDSDEPMFHGTWQVLGKDFHVGVITMKRQGSVQG